MHIFGKQVNAKIRMELLGRLGMILLTGILLALVGVCSFAWFAQNRTTSQDGMQIQVHSQTYDLLVERTSRYEVGYPIITDTDRTKDSLVDDEYSLTATATSTSPRLAYELVNELEYDDEYNLMPGAYGTLTFYLRPLRAGDLTVQFSLNLGGYVVTYDNLGNASFGPIQSTTVLNLLRGHLLFFTQRTGATPNAYCYDGLIADGTFSYNTALHSKCTQPGKTDCYCITLYWEWPNTYDDIVDQISTQSVTRRFPAEMGDYLANTDYFFIALDEGADLNDRSDAYNDADQAIGTGAGSVVAYIAAQ